MIDIQTTPRGVTFRVHVQPRASKSLICGTHQGALKIKLTAAPAKGAANRQCIELLARTLSRPKSTITISSGQTSRNKQITIHSRGSAMPPSEAAAIVQTLQQLGIMA